ncbi:MAG: DEAD/DEAH box helicase [Verrucomicrobia bacterium]|nr:DEAD/DEAH box helicase [Verrucomicrobiota bacterium]
MVQNFSDFNLDPKLLKALKELGYEEPTPVQAQAIPKVLEGADLICSAQTGTGKTAAFMLPALQTLLTTPRSKSARVLILAPTRELAMQITAVTEKYSKYLQLKTVCIYGGVPYPIQTRALSKPHDILVATPGRLLDHMQQGRIDLSNLKFFVLDEADRMLDMGFIEDVEKIAEEAPEDRQTLLFSATLETKILRLSKKLQRNPEEILLEPAKRENVNIEQRLYYVDGMGHKMRLLDHILANTDYKQAIIFIATRNAAETLADELQEKGYVTDALHGNMSQRQRTRTIGRLRRGDINILVATDVAARGIDVRTLTHVINIDLPFQAEDYIHRIGRTGRAGEKGVAITFATYKEEQLVNKINQMMGAPMATLTIEGLEPSAKTKGAGPKQNQKFGRKQRRPFGNKGESSDKKKGPRFGKPFGEKKKDFAFFSKRKKKKGAPGAA